MMLCSAARRHLFAVLAIAIGMLSAPVFAQSSPSLSQADIKEIQERLNTLGYGLTADGVPGLQTRSAIEGYGKLLGIPTDGKPSAAVLNALREKTRLRQGSIQSATPPAAPLASTAAEPTWTAKYRSAFDQYQKGEYNNSCQGFLVGLTEQLRDLGHFGHAQTATPDSMRVVSDGSLRKIDHTALTYYLRAYMEIHKKELPTKNVAGPGFQDACNVAYKLNNKMDIINNTARQQLQETVSSINDYCRKAYDMTTAINVLSQNENYSWFIALTDNNGTPRSRTDPQGYSSTELDGSLFYMTTNFGERICEPERSRR